LKAAERLASYAVEIDEAFGTTAVRTWVVGVGASAVPLEVLGERVSFATLIDQVGEAIADRIGE